MKRALVMIALILASATSLVSQGSIFFTEDFEAGATSFNSTNFGDLGQASFSRVSSSPLAGSWSLRHAVTSGVADPGFATQHFGDAGGDNGGPVLAGTSSNHYDDLYVQWKIRYTSGFVFNVHFKQLIIGTEDNHVHSSINTPNPWSADYLTIYTAGTTRQLRGEYNRKNAQDGSEFFDLFPNLSQADTININQLYTVEVRRKLDTPGASTSDGIFQMWLDGVKIAEYTNVNWRIPYDGSAYGTNETYKNNFVLISEYANTTSTSSNVYYDDFRFSTAYIGTGSAAAVPGRIRLK